jgi:hypothetical protein
MSPETVGGGHETVPIESNFCNRAWLFNNKTVRQRRLANAAGAPMRKYHSTEIDAGYHASWL